MADVIKRDTVDYRDPTPFDNTKLNSLSDISKALRHKTYGEDTREAIAQQGEALAKLMQETGGNQSAEVVAARGKYETLGIREDAQDNAIATTNSNLANKADKTYIDDYLSQVSYVPETVASLDELKSKYPNGKPGLFITADNGHKYIWTTGAWKDAGVYQSQGIPDKSIKALKVADKTLTDQQIKEVNMATVIDSFASITSAASWNGANVTISDSSITAVSDAGDKGVVVAVNLDRIPSPAEHVYINFNYRNPDLVNLKDLVEVYAMDMDNGIKNPHMFSLNKAAESTAASYSMVGQLWPNWELDKNFKLLFVIHGKGSLEISKLTVNYSNRRDNLAGQISNIKSEQLSDGSVTDRAVKDVNTKKISNSGSRVNEATQWGNGSGDRIIIDDDSLKYIKNSNGDNGLKWLAQADLKENVQISLSIQTDTYVEVYIMSPNNVLYDKILEIHTGNGVNLKNYSATVTPDQFDRWGISGEFYVMVAIHQPNTYFKLTDLNVSNTKGLESLSNTVTDLVDNNGLRNGEQVGQSINDIDTLEYIDASKVRYSTYASAVTINNALLKTVRAYVPADGTYSFKVGIIDQNQLIVNDKEFSIKLTSGYNNVNVESLNIQMAQGSYLFMDISKSKQLFKATDNHKQLVPVLIQDEDHQSSKPGYPGMIMYNSEYLLPFGYEVAEMTNKQQLNNLNKSNDELIQNVSDLIKSVNGDVYLKSESGKKFRLVVDDDGNLSTDYFLPDEVVIFGNSLTKERGDIGMAASDQYHDYYHYIVEYIRSKNANVKINPRTNVSVWESATNSADRNTLFNDRMKPILTGSTDLVILQLVDNVNTEEKKATFAADAKTLIKNIHAVSPKAQIFWVARWFADDILLSQIQDACESEGATIIDITSIARMSDTKGVLGATRTGINGDKWVVDNPGEAAHPGDKGMRLIADAIIEKLGF